MALQSTTGTLVGESTMATAVARMVAGDADIEVLPWGQEYYPVRIGTRKGDTFYLVKDEVRQYRFLKEGDGGEIVAEYVAKVGVQGPYSCTCPDHQYRGRRCKHMAATVKIMEKW